MFWVTVSDGDGYRPVSQRETVTMYKGLQPCRTGPGVDWVRLRRVEARETLGKEFPLGVRGWSVGSSSFVGPISLLSSYGLRLVRKFFYATERPRRLRRILLK